MTRAAIKSLDTREATHFSDLQVGDVFKLPAGSSHYMVVKPIEYINAIDLSNGETFGFEDPDVVIPARDVQFAITY
jgi:hypothetical protein